jgi:hypothetical protein
MGIERNRASQTSDQRSLRAWSRRRRHGQLAAVAAVAFAALLTLCAVGASGDVPTIVPAFTAGVEPMEEGGPPKTVAECKKRFAMGSHERAKCIKRVEAELAIAPGTSCQHPWEVNQSEGGHNGGEHYVKITLKATSQGVFTWHWQVMSPSVEICPRGITFEVIQELPNGDEEFKHPSLVKHLAVTRSGSYSYATHAGGPVTNQDLKIEAWSRHPLKY